jgi:hypothetical protein
MIWSICSACKFKELADIFEATGKAPDANLILSWPHEGVAYHNVIRCAPDNFRNVVLTAEMMEGLEISVKV